eukprot:768435-Amphidinium_carterae.1
MAHALANADRIAQDTGFDTNTFIAQAQQAMQRSEMATEHCIAAFVDFYQVRVLVMHKEHQAAWIYIPAGETMAGPSMLVWLHQQHFQSGPTFDLSQINHAIASNADEAAFKAFCLRGGHEDGPWTFEAVKRFGVRPDGGVDAKAFQSESKPQGSEPGGGLDDMPAQHSRVVPTLRDANMEVREGDSIAMNVMMLITSDLCRQVRYPTTKVGDACTPILACDNVMQHPTSDKGTWPKWLHEFGTRRVQMVSDFQPTNQPHAQHIHRNSLHLQTTLPRSLPYPVLARVSNEVRSTRCVASKPIDSFKRGTCVAGTSSGDLPKRTPISLSMGNQCRCCWPTEFHSMPGRCRPNHTRDITLPVMVAWSHLAR